MECQVVLSRAADGLSAPFPSIPHSTPFAWLIADDWSLTASLLILHSNFRGRWRGRERERDGLGRSRSGCNRHRWLRAIGARCPGGNARGEWRPGGRVGRGWVCRRSRRGLAGGVV